MIKINYIYKSKIRNAWMEDSKSFNDAYKALRFLYAIKHKGYIIVSWECDDPEDNYYLTSKFY